MLSLLRGDRPSWADYQFNQVPADARDNPPATTFRMGPARQPQPRQEAPKKPDSFWNSWLWQGIKIGAPLALGFVFPLGFVASTLLIGGTMAAFTVTEKLASKGKLDASDGVDIAVDIGTSFIGGALGRLPIFQGAKTYMSAFIKSALGGGVSGAATGGIGQVLKDGINKGEVDLAHVAQSTLHGAIGGAALGGAFGLVGHKLQIMAAAKKDTTVKPADTPKEKPAIIEPVKEGALVRAQRMSRRARRRRMQTSEDGDPRLSEPLPDPRPKRPVPPESELPPIRLPQVRAKGMRVSAEVATNIRNHVEEGLRLLRQGKHAEAIAHFSKSVPGDCRTSISVGDRMIRCPEGTRGSLQEFFQAINGSARAIRRQSTPDKMLDRIEIIVPRFRRTSVPENPTGPAKTAFDRAEKEIAFGCAEEWIHALQFALNRPVSRQGAFAQRYARSEGFRTSTIREYDIICCLQENRIPVPKTFMGRYERSAIREFLGTHRRLNNDEIQALNGHLTQNQTLNVRSVPLTDENMLIAAVCERTKNRFMCHNGTLSIFDPLGSMNGLSLTLRRLTGGGYNMGAPAAGGPTIRFRLPDGQWQRLTGAMDLPSGTRVRIGLTDFVLP